MPETETPVLHLGYVDDERINRNFRILDDVLHRLARGVQIPDDLSILGSLDVRDNLHVGGDVTVDGHTTLQDVTARTILATAGVQTDSLSVSTFVQLPNAVIEGSDLQPNATVVTVVTGTATTTPIILSTTPGQYAEVCRIDVPAELTGHFSVVVGQATYRIGIGTGSSPSLTVNSILRRGLSTDLQNRLLLYAMPTGNGSQIDIPITMIRLATPTNTTNQYSLFAGPQAASGPVASLACAFAQLHVLQLR